MRSGRRVWLGAVFLALWPALVAAADGTWIQSLDGSWSSPANWSQGAVADGSGSTADFATLDIARDVQVELESSHTVGRLTFADKNPTHGWMLTARNDSAELTLAGDQPRISVHALGADSSASLLVPLAGTTGFIKDGAGTLTLAGTAANEIAGTIQVQEGQLALAKPEGVHALAADNLHIGNGEGAATVMLRSASQIPDTTDVTIFKRGTLNLDGHSETINNLIDDGSGQAIVDGGSGEPLLTIGAGDFSGTIKNTAGKLTLNKHTRGVLFLRGDNTYAGNTIVSEGTLALAGPGTNNIAASPVIRVEQGAWLNVTGLGKKTGLVLAKGQSIEGTGTVRGNVTVAEGGQLAPGNSPPANSPNTLRYEGNQTWGSGGRYVVELDAAGGSASDLLSISGALHIAATAAHPFTIEIVVFHRGGKVGQLPSSGGCKWTIATTTDGIALSGRDPFSDRFVLTAKNMDHSPPGRGLWREGYFVVQRVGNDVVLRYQATTVPPGRDVAVR